MFSAIGGFFVGLFYLVITIGCAQGDGAIISGKIKGDGKIKVHTICNKPDVSIPIGDIPLERSN